VGLLIGMTLKEPLSCSTLAAEQRWQGFVVFLSDATDITEWPPDPCRQMELICAPNHLAVLPLHKPALLQLVDVRHQNARVHMEHLSQSLLAQPSGFVKYAENA